MLPMKITITSIDMPPGTVSVMWNDDPLREFNYNVPVEFSAGNRPYTRTEFLDWLAATHYESMEEEVARKQLDMRNPLGVTLFEEIDLTARGESYRAARDAMPNETIRGPRPQ